MGWGMEFVSELDCFRSVCKVNGADLMYTEFISSEGLIRDAEKSVQKLDIYDSERPIGIQIFGDEIEVIPITKIIEAFERTINKDVRYRFVIDMSTL